MARGGKYEDALALMVEVENHEIPTTASVTVTLTVDNTATQATVGQIFDRVRSVVDALPLRFAGDADLTVRARGHRPATFDEQLEFMANRGGTPFTVNGHELGASDAHVLGRDSHQCRSCGLVCATITEFNASCCTVGYGLNFEIFAEWADEHRESGHHFNIPGCSLCAAERMKAKAEAARNG